jgi:cell division transport system permease protein
MMEKKFNQNYFNKSREINSKKQKNYFTQNRFLMTIHHHLFAFNSAIRRMLEAPLATFIIILVIAIGLALPTGLEVILKNLKTITGNFSQTRQITVYLKDDVSPVATQRFTEKLKNSADINNVRYVSKEAGLEDLKKNSGFGDSLTYLKTNPLPNALVITPEQNLVTKESLAPLLAQIKNSPEVESEQVDSDWLDRLAGITYLISYAEKCLVVLFSFAVLFIVGNTIKLALQNSVQEINIFKLVGARNSFVRRPFLYLGMLYGFLGGVLSWMIIDLVVNYLNIPIRQLSLTYGSNFTLLGLSFADAGMLLLSSSLLGFIGAWLCIMRHLKKSY